MKLEIIRYGNLIASTEGSEEIYLVLEDEYMRGDRIIFTPDEAGFYTIQFDAVLGRSTLYSNGEKFEMEIPFYEKHECYHDSAFKGYRHFLYARPAFKWEYSYRNLAVNPYDHHGNTSLYPHSYANIETRGESVFASRNAFDGITAANGHGRWPWSSWGINRDPKAELTLEFGREVIVDRIAFYNRADFPHDAWWSEARIAFSDGSEEVFSFIKKDGRQEFTIPERKISSLVLKDLIKADDPSPFPALIQLEVYGSEA